MKMDASQGIYQTQLDEESTLLCTVATPLGRYSFTRLSYGINCASEIFHAKVHQLLECETGVRVCMGDIVVWGRTREEHDARLKKALDRSILGTHRVTGKRKRRYKSSSGYKSPGEVSMHRKLRTKLLGAIDHVTTPKMSSIKQRAITITVVVNSNHYGQGERRWCMGWEGASNNSGSTNSCLLEPERGRRLRRNRRHMLKTQEQFV